MKLRTRDPLNSTKFNRFQQAAHISLKNKLLKIGQFAKGSGTALGAGGREFESRRPDQ